MSNRIEKASIEISDYAQSISRGGTSGMSVEQASVNLGYVRNTTLGANGGIAKTNSLGKLPSSVLSEYEVAGNVNTIGPTTTALGGVSNTFVITNYDSFTTYTVSTTNGAVSINGEIITYTPNNVSGAGGFTVNGELFSVSVTRTGDILAPTITSPIQGATNIGRTAVCTSSTFTMTSGTDTHAASHWQISTSPTFATILYESIDDTINKTSWTTGLLSVSTTYYIRVRHKGTTYGYSGWSATRQVATKSSFLPTGESAKLLSGGAVANDQFGAATAVSSDGSTVLVGASNESGGAGAAYVFIRVGDIWIQQAKLVASDVESLDRFGSALSLSPDGSTAVVGAPNANAGSGAAYVFTRTGVTWSQQTQFTGSDVGGGAMFGESVSLSTDGVTLIVGCPNHNSQGVAYLFARSGATWTQQAKIAASDAAVTDWFGYSVSLSSDGATALVGAYGKSSYTGAAYIFTRSGSTWTQQAKLTASDAAVNDLFGASVAIADDGFIALVGSQGNSSNVGATYVFTRAGSIWSQQQKLSADVASPGTWFGVSVSLSTDGSIALVGAHGRNEYAGAAYVFTRTGSTWTRQQIITASDAAFGDCFGYRLSISGDGSVSIVGAYGKGSAMGSAYMFA